MQLFTKVLNHVIPLWFSVNQKIKADPFLETNDSFNLLLDEFFVLFLCDFALAKFSTGLTNLLGLL